MPPAVAPTRIASVQWLLLGINRMSPCPVSTLPANTPMHISIVCAMLLLVGVLQPPLVARCFASLATGHLAFCICLPVVGPPTAQMLCHCSSSHLTAGSLGLLVCVFLLRLLVSFLEVFWLNFQNRFAVGHWFAFSSSLSVWFCPGLCCSGSNQVTTLFFVSSSVEHTVVCFSVINDRTYSGGSF